jgi:hypothetical protein
LTWVGHVVQKRLCCENPSLVGIPNLTKNGDH